VRVAVKDTYIRRLVSWRIAPVSSGKTPLSPSLSLPKSSYPLNFCYGVQEPELAKNLASHSLLPLSPSHSLRLLNSPHCRSSSSLSKHIRLRRATADDTHFWWLRRLKSESCTTPVTTAPAAALTEQPQLLAPFVRFHNNAAFKQPSVCNAAPVFSGLLPIASPRIYLAVVSGIKNNHNSLCKGLTCGS
jgi:hypothetical protein